MTIGHPWEVISTTVVPSDMGPGYVLRLVGTVRRQREDSQPAAFAVARISVGEAVGGPLVFWLALLLWPSKPRRQLTLRVAIAIPIFLGLEAITTATQLIYPLALASATLKGTEGMPSVLEYWGRILDIGGHLAVDACGALVTVALAISLWPAVVRRIRGADEL